MNVSKLSWFKSGLLFSGISVIIFTLSQIPFISCLICPLSCFSWLVLPFLTGFISVKWAEVKSNNFNEAIKQALFAGLTFAFVSGVINLVIGIIFSFFSMSVTSMYSLLDERNNSEMLSNFALFPIGAIGQFVCFIVGFIMNVIIAIIGGIIKVALSKDE